MLSIQEQDQLKELLEQKKRQSGQRLRDEKGRFITTQSHSNQTEVPSHGHRSVKVVKVKGSYNSYLIKDVWFSETDKEIMIVLGIFGLLAIIF